MGEVQFEPVRPIRAYERVVEQIESAVQRGNLKSGEHLPSERNLMKQFDVSRATVREALRVLESQGVVRSRPGDPNGPVILSFSSAPLRKSLRRLASGQGVTLAELLQFRVLLESASALLAAELREDQDVARMEAAISRMAAGVDTGLEQFGEADLEFHAAMAAASRNPLLQLCTEVVHGVALEMITEKIGVDHAPRQLMLEWVPLHQAVLDAIRARDGHQAAALMQHDLLEYYETLVSEEDRETLRRFVAGISGQIPALLPRPEPGR